MSFLAPLGLALGIMIPHPDPVLPAEGPPPGVRGRQHLPLAGLLRDLAAHEPWQRFHWSVLLILQLLVVGALVFAVARPFYVAQAEEEIVHAVLVIDGGASMQATDPIRPDSRRPSAPRTRRSATWRTARSGRSSWPPSSRASWRPPPSTARRWTGPSTAPGDVRPGRHRTGAGAGKLARAWQRDAGRLAARCGSSSSPMGRVRRHRRRRGRQPGHPAGPDRQQRPEPGDHRPPARADPQNVNRYQVFARVRNFADAEYRGTLALNVDGNLAESREVTLAPTATTPRPPSTSSPTCRRRADRRGEAGRARTSTHWTTAPTPSWTSGGAWRSCWSPTATSSWRRC